MLGALALAGVSALPLQAQTTGKFLAPRDQIVAVKAARMFDSRSGTLLNNQTVVIRGDRILDVGANPQIPAGARVIDLGNATLDRKSTRLNSRHVKRSRMPSSA